MTRCFSCGQYTCRIVGNDKLISLPLRGWEKFEQQYPSLQTITICLEEMESDCKISGYDGWLVQERLGFPWAIYCQNGKILFSLQNIEPHVVRVCIRKALDSYLRIGIHYGMMLALYRECIGIHGVTILCEDEIIILSAPSGTGKTTLARLLEKYCDAIVINGDFALLSPTEDGVIYEPTPFCGTSGRSLNHRFRVNEVVFLGQAQENDWRKLTGREAIARFMSNVFVPEWDRNIQQTVQENILKSISMLKVNAYDFVPTQEAAEKFLRMVQKKFWA